MLSDSETLDEGFETQSNVSETIELTPQPSTVETTAMSKETPESNASCADETLADELTRRLNFNSTRRLSHDSSTKNNNNEKRSSLAQVRPPSLLKTSTSAYSYPTFTSTGQQNQPNSAFTKRTPSAESLRSTSTSNTAAIAMRSNRHIQRCAVSRRIWTEKDFDEVPKVVIVSSPSAPTPSTSKATAEAEQTSLSSAAIITTTTPTTNRRLSTTKPKTKIRAPHSGNATPSQIHSPNLSKFPSRLAHATSCQNFSTPAALPNSKSSPATKVRSPPSFFLNSSQLLRSSFNRTADKPLRALPMSTTMNADNLSTHRASPRSRRLFSSSSDLDSNSIASPKTSRKPPSSWHHSKPVANKTPLATVLPSSGTLTTHRKTSSSTTDLRKTAPMSTSVFQRIQASKQF